MQSGIPSWLQIAGLIVAGYGAALSTVTVILRQRDRRAQLVVTARSVRAVTDFGRVSPVMLEIRANNTGVVAVHLNTCGYAVSRRMHAVIAYSDMPLGSHLPETLEPGRSFCYAIEASKVAELGPDATVRLRPWYTDDVGHTYYGKFRRIDLSEPSPGPEAAGSSAEDSASA